MATGTNTDKIPMKSVRMTIIQQTESFIINSCTHCTYVAVSVNIVSWCRSMMMSAGNFLIFIFFYWHFFSIKFNIWLDQMWFFSCCITCTQMERKYQEISLSFSTPWWLLWHLTESDIVIFIRTMYGLYYMGWNVFRFGICWCEHKIPFNLTKREQTQSNRSPASTTLFEVKMIGLYILTFGWLMFSAILLVVCDIGVVVFVVVIIPYTLCVYYTPIVDCNVIIVAAIKAK